MIDYKDIVASDPGGDMAAAFESLKAQTVTTQVDRLVTYRMIAGEAGFDAAVELENKVDTMVASSQLPAWVSEALQDEGINVNDPQVEALLGQMVDGVTFAQTSADKILALRNNVSPKFPGLKAGHIQNAREWKAIFDADPGGDLDAALLVIQQTLPRCGKGDLQKARGFWG